MSSAHHENSEPFSPSRLLVVSVLAWHCEQWEPEASCGVQTGGTDTSSLLKRAFSTMSTLGHPRTSSRNYLSVRERISQSSGDSVLEADTKMPSSRAEQTPSQGHPSLALHRVKPSSCPAMGRILLINPKSRFLHEGSHGNQAAEIKYLKIWK